MNQPPKPNDIDHAGHVHGPDCEHPETPIHVHGPECAHEHEHASATPYRRAAPKLGRNDPCWCGSGRKWKKCHGAAA